ELVFEMSRLAPSLPGAAGFFNPYGRVYLDGAHLELAAAECASPFALVNVIAAQQDLAAQAVRRLRKRGREVLLANCNHSGLLTDSAPTWGSHGNYLVSEHPMQLAERLLPFLVTRVYAGAGGLAWPSGEYVAGVRLRFLKAETGGDTMQQRAIHSTARDEPLTTQPQRYGWRYHTVLGDGLRSHFSQLLRFGVTALVLQAITQFPQALKSLPVPRGAEWQPGFWLHTLAYFNRLAITSEGLKAEPLAVEVQRVYLELVDRFLNADSNPPLWTRQVVTVWESTLDALERQDHAWLAARLDPWIKFDLFSEYLMTHGSDWECVRSNHDLAYGLALLNQDYHDFTSPSSPFSEREQAGRLCHEVMTVTPPGSEPEPYVPDCGTRANARARFLSQHPHERHLTADWTQVTGIGGQVLLNLDDPFADG
ncbi:MAG: proteasome accessory factor PafA2 family protein, partial [Planctomycetaceae bacterium]|nr:proteasome accessory factor PafA2 family protein [Planctomycetaceae bacterium]